MDKLDNINDIETRQAESMSILEIDIDRICLNPNQPRKYFDEEKLDELAQSIMQNGVIEPVIVRPVENGLYELVAGERRFRASVQAGLRRIPAVSRVMDDRKSMEIALIENIQREDIRPMECAQAYRYLMDEFGMTQEQVADRVGKRRSTVANTLRLLNLPHDILDSLDRGDITEGHARALLSITDMRRQVGVWQEVLKNSLSVRDTERLARNPGISGKPSVARATKGKGVSDPNLADIEEKLRRFLGTKVLINKVNESKGKLEIEFYDDEDLMRILELIAQM
ncbi:MAG: ParB/RepB/Spo0J family partition protein [Armatimonadota bacterium]